MNDGINTQETDLAQAGMAIVGPARLAEETYLEADKPSPTDDQTNIPIQNDPLISYSS